MKKKIILTLFTLSFFLITFFSCTKEVAKLLGPNDSQLFGMAADSNHRFYYQNDSTVFLSPQGGSPHGTFKLRFNAAAKNALGGDGKLAVQGEFPDSSLITKVMYSGPQGSIVGYAVMFKLNKAWFRAEYGPTGVIYTGITGDISSCLSCHQGPNNRDQILTFFYH